MREEEGRLSEFTISPEEFHRDGFSENRFFTALVMESEKETSPLGFATYFFAYSGDVGRALYLEDIYIKPEFRDKGLGSRLFKRISQICLENGCHRMEWTTTNEPSWNAKTLAWYKKFKSIDENKKQLYLQGNVLSECANENN